MYHDPIVEEIHRIREEIYTKFNGDARAIYDEIRRRQEKKGRDGSVFENGGTLPLPAMPSSEQSPGISNSTIS